MGVADSKARPAGSANVKVKDTVAAPHEDVMDSQLKALEAELAASQATMSTVQQQKIAMLEAEIRLQAQLAAVDAGDDGEAGGEGGDEEEMVIEEHELAELEAELEALEESKEEEGHKEGKDE